MTLPFGLGSLPLPDWLPWWVPAVLLIPVLLYGLLALAVPFSVFGLKGRMEGIELRLDDLHAEIRGLVARLPPALGDEYAPRAEAARGPVVTPYYPETTEPAPLPVPERVRLVPAPVRAPRADSRPVTRQEIRAEPRLGPR